MAYEKKINYRIHYKGKVINIWAYSFEINEEEKLYRFFDKESSTVEIPASIVDSMEEIGK